MRQLANVAKAVSMAAILVSLSVPAAHAAKGEWIGGGNIGMGIPTGDFGDLANSGFYGGVFLDYMMSENFGFGADIGYMSFSAKDEYIDSFDGEITDITSNVFMYGAHGRWLFSPAATATPHVTFGVGAYSATTELEGPAVDDGLVPDEESSTDMGINAGLGFTWKMGPSLGLGAEGLYHNIFTEDESTSLFTVAARITFSFAATTQ